MNKKHTIKKSNRTFAFGGYNFKTPNEVLLNNKKDRAEAVIDANNNIVTQFLDLLSGTIGTANGLISQYGLPKASYGGKVPVEVEGGEMGELPNGMLLNFEGNSHEHGGIPLSLPVGTKIYSDRITIDGKTMSERKSKREKKISNLQKKIKKGDRVSKATLERYMLSANKEEELDMSIQNSLNTLSNKNRKEYGGGGSVNLANLTEQANLKLKSIIQNKINSFNSGDNILPYIGDAIGILGNYKAGKANQEAVDSAKAIRTPNMNAFKNYGKNGLETLNQTKKYVRGMGEIARRDIEGQRVTATSQNRQSARGVNTMRALDLATQANANRLDLQAYQQEIAQLQAILGQEANMKNQQDQIVMSGEQARDLRDRDDDANLNNMQLRANLAKANALTHIGNSFNEILERDASMNAINDNYTNFKYTPSGKLRTVPNQYVYIDMLDAVRKNPKKYNLTEEQIKDLDDKSLLKLIL